MHVKLGENSETFISKWLYSHLLPLVFKVFVAWGKLPCVFLSNILTGTLQLLS